LLRRKRAGKHDFQNNSLRFDMHKIVAGIEQKKIVLSGQLLVTGFLAVCVLSSRLLLTPDE